MARTPQEGMRTPEQRAIAYTEAWRNTLRWRSQYRGEAKTPDGIQRVAVLSLLTPPQQIITEYEQARAAGQEGHIESPTARFIAQTTPQYLGDRGLARHTPDDLQVILYPEDRHEELFPEHGVTAGFGYRRGGYSAIFMPLPLRENGEYGFQPLYLGRELGDIMYSHMLRRRTGHIGATAAMEDHLLQEGWSEVVGVDYYNYLMEQQGQQSHRHFDSIWGQFYEQADLHAMLGDVPFATASHRQQDFMRHMLAGSLVSRLVEQYGIEKVAEFFAKEADATARKGEEFAQTLKATNGAGAELGISVSFATERTANPPKNRPELVGILKELGYDTPEYFVDISSGSTLVDNRPEGAIASAIIDQFDAWFNRPAVMDGPAHEPLEQAARRQAAQGEGPTFVGLVQSSLDTYRAKQIFGADFSATTFVDTWKQDMIQRYSPIIELPQPPYEE